jgi:uncharacterized C2H2 Zn-finger protein
MQIQRRLTAYSSSTQRPAASGSSHQLTTARITSHQLAEARINSQQLIAACNSLPQLAAAMKRYSIALQEKEATGESPSKRLRRPTYPCPNCDMVFNNRTTRARHVKKHHDGGRIHTMDQQFHYRNDTLYMNDILMSFVDVRRGDGDTIAFTPPYATLE